MSARPLFAAVLLLTGCERSGIQLEYEIPPKAPLEQTVAVVQHRLERVAGRADVLGQGRQIRVRVPGGRSIERVKEFLAQPAHLQITLYREDLNASLPLNVEWGTAKELYLRTSLLKPPKDCRIAAEESSHGTYRAVCVGAVPIITEANIADATASDDKVMLRLDANAAERFGDATAANVGKRLSIVLDGVILQSPVVMDAIRGGRMMLSVKAPQSSGTTDAQYAEALAGSLTAGGLPEMTLVSETRYGPQTKL